MQRIRFFTILALAALLPACGKSYGITSATTSPTGSGALVRFAQGSPDNAAMDFRIDNLVVNGNVAWRSITPYVGVNPGNHQFSAVTTGTTSVVGGTQSISIAAGGKYTLVLGGKATASPSTATLFVFKEPGYSTGAGSAAVTFHNAAPDAGASQTVGTYATASGAPTSSAFVTVNNQIGPVTFATTAGVGVYAQAPSVASLLPANLDVSDSTNTLPFNADQNLSVYVIDGPLGVPGSPLLIGIFDGNG